MALQTTGITTTLVGNTIGLASNDVGTLCSSIKINKWSKHKPVRYTTTSPLTDAQLKDVNYGLNVTSNTNLDSPTEWTYLRPSGGYAQPYRLGDFRGYNHQARPFLWLNDYEWNYYDIITPADIVIVPAFMFGTGSADGQGGAGGGNIDLLPKDFNLPDYGGSFENFYIGLYYKVDSGTSYYCYSDKTIGQATSSNALTINFQIGENGQTTTQFTEYIQNNMSVNDVWEMTPFMCLTRAAQQTKFTFPNGQKFYFTKKNVYAEQTKTMWKKLNMFVNGSINFTNYTKTINLGNAGIYSNVTSSTPVSKLTNNAYPADVIKVTINGQVTVNETVTVNWNGIRAFVDGVGTGNYNTPIITVNGVAQNYSTGSYLFQAGTTYGISFTDYVSGAGNLLSNLPLNATYLNAAKPTIGLIKYETISYINGVIEGKAMLCIGN